MMSSARKTHPVVRGFDRTAETYERGRPDYPAAAVAHLGRVLHLGRSTTVVDLASGTGKFTRALAPLGAARIAVEPMEGMRRVFAREVPDVPVVAGTAEEIPLPDGFADAVVAAQAFHWFRPRPALREIARVLRPKGGVGLVWNIRDESVDWSRQLTEIIERYRYSRLIPRSRERRWRREFERAAGPFGPLHERVFRHVQRAPRETFVSRVLSVSVVAVLPSAERRKVVDQVRGVLDTDPLTRGRAVLEMPYRTEVYWAFRR
jgi:SAM-dependent methyltransferase